MLRNRRCIFPENCENLGFSWILAYRLTVKFPTFWTIVESEILLAHVLSESIFSFLGHI